MCLRVCTSDITIDNVDMKNTATGEGEGKYE